MEQQIPDDPDATLAAVASAQPSESSAPSESPLAPREPNVTRAIADDDPTVVMVTARRLAPGMTAGEQIVDIGDRTTAELPPRASGTPGVASRPLSGAPAGQAAPSAPASPQTGTAGASHRGAYDWEQNDRVEAHRHVGGSVPGRQTLGATLADLPTTILPTIRLAARRARRGPLARRMPYPVLAILLLLSLVVSFAGTLSVVQLLDARAAANDAKVQVAAIESALKGGGLLQTEGLIALQGHLRALESDLARARGDVPFESLVSGNAGVASLLRLVAMAQDLAAAGDHGVSAALILLPGLKSVLHGLGGGSNGTAGKAAAPDTGPLTAAQIQTATDDINTATALLQRALVERKQVRDSDLQSLGLASLAPLLHKLDAATPKLNTYLGQAHTVMAALPSLLGIGKPINYLLFNMDSDELRPTGGFLGNYAILSVAGGKLDSGVHLHDVMELDCPNSNCYPRALPPQFSWFPFARVAGTEIFDVRDSNLDPDFPASARLAEQFAQEEGTPPLGGVIAITPGLIEQILNVTGQIDVAPFHVIVTPANLQDEIHYFHILNAYCVGYAADPRCAVLDNPALQEYQTTGRKVFDAVLGSELMHALGTLPPDRQSKLFQALANSLQTKDLQVYINDPRVESLLTEFHVDDAVQAPSGDSLFVVDANIGAMYANGDVRDDVRDTITLDTHGNATHDLTITYSYPIVPHSWSDIYPAAGGSFLDRDVTRVILPKQARLGDSTNCYSPDGAATESGHAVFSCEFVLYRTNTLTLRFHWTVPHAAVTANGTTQYTLLLEKQAGTHSNVSVMIVLPAHMRLVGTPAAPLAAGKTGSTVQYTGTLDKNLPFVISYQ